METKKLTSVELEQLKDFSEKRNQITFNLGQLDIQMAFLQSQRNYVLEELTKLQEEENIVGKNLQDKYGDGNINIENGEFTPNQ